MTKVPMMTANTHCGYLSLPAFIEVVGPDPYLYYRWENSIN